jgi:protease I
MLIEPTMKRILIITGDAGESYETLYAKHRFEEAGYQSVIAAPSKKRLNLVIHDFEPGWDTYIERKGYLVESDIAFSEVKTADYEAILLIGGRAPEYLRNDNSLIEIVKNRNITCYEHVKFEVESCGGTFVGKDQAVKDGKIVTGQTWQSHPEFYREVFKCLA